MNHPYQPAFVGVDQATAAGAMLCGNAILTELLLGVFLAQMPEAQAQLIARTLEAELSFGSAGMSGHPDIEATRRQADATAKFMNCLMERALRRASMVRAGRGG